MNGMQSETDERNFTHLHHNSWRERYANSLSMLALTETRTARAQERLQNWHRIYQRNPGSKGSDVTKPPPSQAPICNPPIRNPPNPLPLERQRPEGEVNGKGCSTRKSLASPAAAGPESSDSDGSRTKRRHFLSRSRGRRRRTRTAAGRTSAGGRPGKPP